MTWATYSTFLVFAVVIVLAPGPDFALVLRNSLARGRAAGLFTSIGVCASCVAQGTLAAFGVGAIIARSQPLFLAVRWAGVVYLGYLGVSALLAARRNHDDGDIVAAGVPSPGGSRLAALRQGFVCNATNPKVLAFYLSVLPQFLGHPGRTPVIDAIALAYTHALLGMLWLAALVTVIHSARGFVARRRVRRALHAATGTALVGFASALALESR